MSSSHYQFGYQIHRADRAMGLALDVALRPTGVTAAQAGVLLHIDRFPKASMAQLARLASVTPQTTHRIVVGLERRGLVTRAPTVGDKKSLAVSITRSGSAVLAKAESALRAAQDVLLNVFSHSEFDLFYEFLERFERAYAPEQRR